MPRADIIQLPQARADKLIGKAVQPLPRLYNGQGTVQPSSYVPLNDDAGISRRNGEWQAACRG